MPSSLSWRETSTAVSRAESNNGNPAAASGGVASGPVVMRAWLGDTIRFGGSSWSSAATQMRYAVLGCMPDTVVVTSASAGGTCTEPWLPGSACANVLAFTCSEVGVWATVEGTAMKYAVPALVRRIDRVPDLSVASDIAG